MNHIEWDDLRIALAIVEAGSLAGAARTLGVNQTTVLRRLEAMETRLNTRLFERQRSGYLPTDMGELLVQEARHMAPRVYELERRVLGRDLRLTGNLRLTTAYSVMGYLMPAPLAQFAAAHPGIEVEVTENRELLDLSHRQADVAVRLSRQVPEHWVGRQLGTAKFKVYAKRGEPGLPQAVTPLPDLLKTVPWISFEKDVHASIYNRWMHTHIPPQQVRLRVDMFNTMAGILNMGLGVGVMPCFAGETEKSLVAISEPIAELATPLWVLTHPDLRFTARIQTFMHEVGDALAVLLKSFD